MKTDTTGPSRMADRVAERDYAAPTIVARSSQFTKTCTKACKGRIES